MAFSSFFLLCVFTALVSSGRLTFRKTITIKGGGGGSDGDGMMSTSHMAGGSGPDGWSATQGQDSSDDSYDPGPSPVSPPPDSAPAPVPSPDDSPDSDVECRLTSYTEDGAKDFIARQHDCHILFFQSQISFNTLLGDFADPDDFVIDYIDNINFVDYSLGRWEEYYNQLRGLSPDDSSITFTYVGFGDDNPEFRVFGHARFEFELDGKSYDIAEVEYEFFIDMTNDKVFKIALRMPDTVRDEYVDMLEYVMAADAVDVPDIGAVDVPAPAPKPVSAPAPESNTAITWSEWYDKYTKSSSGSGKKSKSSKGSKGSSKKSKGSKGSKGSNSAAEPFTDFPYPRNGEPSHLPPSQSPWLSLDVITSQHPLLVWSLVLSGLLVIALGVCHFSHALCQRWTAAGRQTSKSETSRQHDIRRAMKINTGSDDSEMSEF